MKLTTCSILVLVLLGIGTETTLSAAGEKDEEVVLSLREPRAVEWKSLTLETILEAPSRSLQLSAALNGASLSRLEIVIDGHDRRQVPQTILSGINRAQLHTITVFVTRESNGSLSFVTITMNYGEAITEGDAGCSTEDPRVSDFNEIRFNFDLSANEITREAYDPCLRLLENAAKK